jgi:putative nucleotidyltransferase with HDIG domain
MFGLFKKSTRLGQWNGRKHSTRGDDRVLPLLLRRRARFRLVTVLVATVLGSILAWSWGPPIPYRVGAIYANDLRVRASFEIINQPLTEQAREEALDRLQPSDSTDPVSREVVRRAVPPVIEKYPMGTLLVPRGQPVSVKQLSLLIEEHRAYLRSLSRTEHTRRGIGLFLVMGLLATLVVIYVIRFQPGVAASHLKIAMISALALATLTVALWLSQPPWCAVLIPLTMTAMILTIAYNPQFALLMTFSLALAVTVCLGRSLDQLLIDVGGLATAVMLLRNVRTRTRLIEVGLGAGLAYLAMTVATGLLSAQTTHFVTQEALRHLAWGTLAGFLVSGLLPVVERSFGIVTDISLRELADGSHPLLQELVRRAPGTYTHSITMATLSEAAAEAIGANPLLTRVGCYFHDIGKMLKPHYFVENQKGENLHETLEPALSTLVIMGHVKDGLELARQYRLPRPVIDFIQQHHGTTLVEYFYREALRLQQNQGEHVDLESSFRYPGPKPQSCEIGIVMLADAVESSSRALAHPTPSSLRKLVHDLLMKRLLDGQFEESGLTLTELHRIEGSLCKSLIALYHARIKYPDERVREAAS